MEEHVHREIRRVAEPRIDTDVALIDGHESGELHETIQPDEYRNRERRVPPVFPEFFGIENRNHDNEVRKEMRKRHPPFHALVVAPEAFEGIRAECVGYRNQDHKRRKSPQKPRTTWPVGHTHQGECEPRARYDLHDDTECEILAGDERKEKRARDVEDDE